MIGRHPFTQERGISGAPLGVLRELIRQMKAFDELVDLKPLQNLTIDGWQALWESDVVITITGAEMPEHLAGSFRQALAEKLDLLLHADEYQRREARKIASAYAEVPTFGMF